MHASLKHFNALSLNLGRPLKSEYATHSKLEEQENGRQQRRAYKKSPNQQLSESKFASNLRTKNTFVCCCKLVISSFTFSCPVTERRSECRVRGS
ncbi:hypothetical protein Mgra_00001119 [Meloidogyne graminicola]|uniref:Uncharacterized protein n=1 Tax=Meloidogyne graminicola TaxID=189291 RepID=A0A8T0A384_9BILA|nr:hypothetical protein Mgra_00001119 [Meloidogyne graminicola]